MTVVGNELKSQLDVASNALSSYCSELRASVRTMDGLEVLEQLIALESSVRQAQAAAADLTAQAIRLGLGRDVCATSPANWLSQVLRIDRGEAGRRVRAAELIADRVTLTGDPQEPIHPVLSDSVRSGLLSAEHVHVVGSALNRLPARLSMEQISKAEQYLVETAEHFPPRDVRTVATRIQNLVDPDGAPPTEAELAHLRYLTMRECADGMIEGRFRLTPAAGAKAIAVIEAQAAPRHPKADDADQDAGDATGEPANEDGPAVKQPTDRRTPGERRADALEELCDLALNIGKITPTGPHIELTIIMTEHDVNAAVERARDDGSDEAAEVPNESGQGESRPAGSHPGVGLAETGYGQQLRVDTALKLIRSATINLLLCTATGVPLALNRTQRRASKGQRRALAARDRHCTFPGCQRPPAWCESHHVEPWLTGGDTDIENLTLLCAFHHHMFETEHWTCEMRDGLPWWIPPKSIDPWQRPQHNRHLHPNRTLPDLE